MTVKCLSPLDKAYIADAFTAKTQDLNELALTFGRSRRTIIRVLEEYKVDTGVKPRVPKETPARPMKDQELDFLGTTTGRIWAEQPAPWYRKVLRSVVGLFKPAPITSMY